ncbi:RNA methyltransferase, TrmH family, group 3 [Commensalibacter intestini A911]|uniref:Ribosomal large subunit pseudouridine synthase n=2 Tax=Commensalibacter intestini TaxID=479936 RepID=A0A251ZSG3_9PROT|nr:23S rRNA (guanosine(2251)-2'-O)-methyltransferase RlmB [Commensalibacter intestini]EHD14054.1 RNA methyltransferase, TrmH family, group 3 [Commensalibacter intestini A911]OUI77601.1 ribosomal large subunit pseudouridine synthase [Commensalibacter intestini]
MGKRPHSNSNTNTNYNIKGGFWLYGQHAVQAALINRKRQKMRLVATVDAYAAVAEKLDAPLKVGHEIVDRSVLDQICGKEAVHQGVALHVMPLGSASIEEMLERSGPILMLDQVTDPRNIGAILRSAVAFGAAGVILQDRHSPDESGVLAKAASGGLDNIPIMRAVNLSRELTKLKEAGLWVVGLDAHGNLLNGADFAQRRVVLVLGAEGAGIRQLTKKNCDEIASLRMTGDIDSLNVSVAGAIALYEITRSFF